VALASCEPHVRSTGAPTPSNGSVVVAGAPSLSAAAAPSAPAPLASTPVAKASAASPFAEYPAFAPRLDAPCADPRAVLAVRKNYDRSGRLLVQQALVAHPELEVVAEKAQAPGQVDFYETIYGTKTFAPKYRGDPMYSEAVVARCADVETCNRVAALIHAISRSERIELVCGTPPQTTGGFSRVRELALDKLAIPDEKSAPPAHCYRALACAARQGLAKRPSAACRELKPVTLRACSVQASCGDVAACVEKEQR
jgi:hypothetical protein